MALLDDIRTKINEAAAEQYFGCFVIGPSDMTGVSRTASRTFRVPKSAPLPAVKQRVLQYIAPDRVLELPAVRAMLDEGVPSATRRQFQWTLTVNSLSAADAGDDWEVTASLTISFTEVPVGT